MKPEVSHTAHIYIYGGMSLTGYKHCCETRLKISVTSMIDSFNIYPNLTGNLILPSIKLAKFFVCVCF